MQYVWFNSSKINYVTDLLGTYDILLLQEYFSCFQYTNIGEFIVQKRRESHYLYHDTNTVTLNNIIMQ